MRYGLQIHLPTFRGWTAREVTEFALRAQDAGLDQIWLTDNVGARSSLALLSALAAGGVADLGWGVMVQYLRSPLEAASGIATVAELMERGVLDIALGAGNPFTGTLLRKERPIRFMQETASCIRAALRGEDVRLDDYPLVRDHFGFQSGGRVAPAFGKGGGGRVRILGGGNGPLGVALAARQLDGLLVGWTFLPALRLARLDRLLGPTAARQDGSPGFLRVAEVKLSVDRSHERARAWVASKEESARLRCMSLLRRGYTPADLIGLGLDPEDVAGLAAPSSRPLAPVRRQEAMVDACFIAGGPEHCREQLAPVVQAATDLGFEQLMFSELGPAPREALDLLGTGLLPALRTGGTRR